jgi:hypothetical protein
LQADLVANGWQPYNLNSLLAALPKTDVVDAMTYTIMQGLGSSAGHGSWEYDFIQAARAGRLQAVADVKDFKRIIAVTTKKTPSNPLVWNAWNQLRTEMAELFKAEYSSIFHLRSSLLAEVRKLGNAYPLIKCLRWDLVTPADLLDYLNRC